MIFFCDRNVGKQLPASLRARGIEAITHDDHFPQATTDESWLPIVGQRGWFVITRDRRIRFNKAERDALVAHGVGCFVLTRADASTVEMDRCLLVAWDDILRIIATIPRPFLYAVHADGKVRRYPLT
jgi:hypothetical protein